MKVHLLHMLTDVSEQPYVSVNNVRHELEMAMNLYAANPCSTVQSYQHTSSSTNGSSNGARFAYSLKEAQHGSVAVFYQ